MNLISQEEAIAKQEKLIGIASPVNLQHSHFRRSVGFKYIIPGKTRETRLSNLYW